MVVLREDYSGLYRVQLPYIRTWAQADWIRKSLAASGFPGASVHSYADLPRASIPGYGSAFNAGGASAPNRSSSSNVHPWVTPAAPLKVSSAAIQSSKLSGRNPQYPPIAKAARIQGTVILDVTISRTGMVEDVHALSGPPMLQQAATDAVRTWRYRPYFLNGEAVEIETQINVDFTLND